MFLELDALGIRYRLIAMRSEGDNIELTKAVSSLHWSEGRDEFARRLTVRLAETRLADGRWLSQALPLCTRVRLRADDVEVFYGLIWDWELVTGEGRCVTLTAYDSAIYLTKSKDNAYFSPGKSTGALLRAICRKWGVPLSFEYGGCLHDKQVFRGRTVADMILSVLEEARRATGVPYVVSMVGKELCVRERGRNADVYTFSESSLTAAELRYGMGMNRLVTRVLVTGSEDNGRIPVLATFNGQTEYGVLQEIVSGAADLNRARSEAEWLLRERGAPETSVTLCAPNVPFIRKGDLVRCKVGVLNGPYCVLGVAHDADKGLMEMELTKWTCGA